MNHSMPARPREEDPGESVAGPCTRSDHEQVPTVDHDDTPDVDALYDVTDNHEDRLRALTAQAADLRARLDRYDEFFTGIAAVFAALPRPSA